MFKIASLVAALTILSKILGLVRDLVIAHYFGTSMLADAFNMAYLFTGNFFIIFGTIGGPFYSSIIATLPKLQEGEVWSFIKRIISRSALALALIAAAIYLFKKQILSLFVESGTEYFNITLLNIDILLPLIIICGPIGIIFAVLNTYKKYIEPSLSPAVVNIALIATVFMMGDTSNGIALALGTSIGGILSLGFQLPSLISLKKGMQDTDPHVPRPTSHVPQFTNLLYPALLTTGVSQLMVFVDGFFCKGLEEGSWTALVLANRLIQMPLGILLTAFLVPVFPRITELIAQGKLDEMQNKLTKAIGALLALATPAVVIGLIWAEPLIRLVFERGAFDSRSTAMVSTVFFYLSFSILPYLLKDSFTRTLYSFGDSRSPLYVMLMAIVLKFISNYFLVDIFGLEGIAISTSIVSCFSAIVLYILLRKKLK